MATMRLIKKMMSIGVLVFVCAVPMRVSAATQTRLNPDAVTPATHQSDRFDDSLPRLQRMKKRAAARRNSSYNSMSHQPSFLRRGVNACVDAFAATVGSIVGCVAALYLLSSLVSSH